ncbi:THxN family PEP-CTERM protein [Fuscibacter oryzae]|uniref:THxN family PEP-CTERM protein n=1 Tax=Fuscibacter oryzae TaxID=2803939 RepID=A0A8J7MNG2_9RHOB|nr:THxN family PEP-CTERM protein [Fuscibacter oryzae]MBL4927462.1 THxN family PEP-CTERM protein [Fuscibacter oryzae]
MKKLSSVITTAVFILAANVATAAQVSLTTISGIWSAGQLTNNQSPTGVGTSDINWGTSWQGNPLSGYSFDAALAPSVLVQDQPFDFGLFTHKNFPILGSTLSWARLDLTFDLMVDGVLRPLSASYLFTHVETPNVGGGNCCNDRVNFDTLASAYDSVNIDGLEFTFKLDGFLDELGKPVSFFSTEENKNNTAHLVGRFTTLNDVPPVSPVPLPASAVLLGAALLGLRAAGLRRKA